MCYNKYNYCYHNLIANTVRKHIFNNYIIIIYFFYFYYIIIIIIIVDIKFKKLTPFELLIPQYK